MTVFNFADSYRAAGIAVTPEILRLREEPFEKLRKSIDAWLVVDLTRLYFGMTIPRGTDWFRDAFGASDPSFSMHDNQREAAVLAASLLKAAIHDAEDSAALAVLTGYVGGLRKPIVEPELVEKAKYYLSATGIEERRSQVSEPTHIRLPSKSKVPGEADALLEAPDWQKAAALFKKMSEEFYESTKLLANQVAQDTRDLSAEAAILREEVDMLWWYIGGWSRVLERPFSDLPVGLAAAMAGLDLADLSESFVGPAAAPAILQRLLLANRKGRSASVSINDVVDASSDDLKELELSEGLNKASDVCPILTAFERKRDIGPGDAWHRSYAKLTGLKATAKLAPLALAMQVYRERKLLTALG
jgi:hypothetical protein